ncbi:MAG: glycosyltransferase family 2 protein [Methanobacteriaceae archaeon]|nr:glycosyltransferase family 2 protein [Methanobacteriaceae archaeon]
MESKCSENLTKDESDTISEFLPPPNPKIAFNHISQEISERAKAILDDLLTKKQITPDKVNPADRHMGFPTQTPGSIRRIFEMIPGIFTWIFILTPLIAVFMSIPYILVGYITVIVIYWLYRAFLFVYGLWIGIKRTRHDVKVGWMDKIQNEYREEYEKLKYVLIYPVYNEGLETIEPSVAGWADSDVDTQKISFVVAIEEKHAQQCIEYFEYIKQKYGHYFREIIYYVHPANIKGEVMGIKGGNINWATRHFVQKIKERGEDSKDYLLFTFDCDQIPHKKYMSAITYKFLSSKNRYHKFYSSAVHTFNNNLWRVPALVRVFSTSLTLVVLHGWTVLKKSKDTWSSYAVSLKTVEDVNYWCPDIENDDTAFYWNAKVRFDGDFSGEEVYIPTYNDAVENESYVKTHRSLYNQQHRWGWGIIVFPITLAGLYYNGKIPLKKRLRILWTLFDNQLFFLTVVYLITFGIPLLNFFSKMFLEIPVSYNIPSLLGYILLGATLLNIPIVILRRNIIPVPEGWPWWRHVWDFIETGAIMVNMLTFGFLPYVQAQTELLLGMKPKRKFNVTEKVVIKGSSRGKVV